MRQTYTRRFERCNRAPGGASRSIPRARAAIAKAVAAALFAYHELKVARDDALASDLLRRHLVHPIEGLLAKVQDVPSLLKTGGASALGGVTSAFDGLKGAAGSAGINLKELATPSLGG